MIRPLGDVVVVRVLETLKKTVTQSADGPSVEQKEVEVETYLKAVVKAVGPGEMCDGQRTQMDVVVADMVLLSANGDFYNRREVPHDGTTCLLVDVDDIVAVVEEDC